MGGIGNESLESIGVVDKREQFYTITSGVNLFPQNGNFASFLDKIIDKHLNRVGFHYRQPLVEFDFGDNTKLIFIKRRNGQVQARLEKRDNVSIVDIQNLDSLTLDDNTILLSWKWSMNARRSQHRLSINTDSGECSLHFYNGKDFYAQVQF